jgi:BMFP domain-containing protein YqiC
VVSRTDIHQARTEATEEGMKAKINKNQEKMETAIESLEEEMRASICSIRAELEQTVQHRVEDVLVSLDDRTQGTQAEVEAKKAVVDTTRRGLESKVAGVTDDILEGLGKC